MASGRLNVGALVIHAYTLAIAVALGVTIGAAWALVPLGVGLALAVIAGG